MGSGRQRAVSGVPGDGTGRHPTPTKRGEGRISQEVGEEEPIEGGKDVHEDDGSDKHRDKRQKRNDDARLGSESVPESSSGTQGRVHLELQTERAEPWVGPPMHDPELYERIQRDREAGVYIGPGAGIVGRYTPQPPSDHAAGCTPAPAVDVRAGDATETVISATGTSSGADADVDEPPMTAKKRPRVEGGPGSGGSDSNSNSKSVEGQKGKDVAVGENSSDSFDPEEWQYPQPARQRKTRDIGPEFAQRIVISSDESDKTEYVRNGERIKERAHPPTSPQFTPSPDLGKRHGPPITYTSFYQERLIKEIRREFKPMGRRRLLRAFPPQTHPTRRIRTWSASRISTLGNFGLTLASALPPRPQLTRPGRRVDLFYDERAPAVKQEDSPSENDPRQLPLLSIEEEPEDEAGPSTRGRSEHPPREDIPEQHQVSAHPETAVEEPPKRARRQAAIAGRQKMLEHAPPARRSTRGTAARKTSVSSSRGPQASVRREDERVVVPETISEEAEDVEDAESSSRPKQTRKGKAKSRVPSKAPAKAKASKTAPKKPASKPRTQPRSKTAPKAKAVSKPAKGGAKKKGK